MEILRTSDDRFVGLPAWPYEPHYVELDGGALRMHVVIEGDPSGRPVLLVHGEPTWSYLYRKMIPSLVDRGFRVVAPDLIGFGRSDKPAAKADYTYDRHVGWLGQLVTQLDLADAIFFGQDWGSLTGLAMVMRHQARFAGIVVANGGLPDPRHPERTLAALASSPDPDAFFRWQRQVAELDHLPVGDALRFGLAGSPGLTVALDADEAAAYDAPFPEASFQSGLLVFPALIAAQHDGDDPDAIMRATWDDLERWTKPFPCIYGETDPILGGFDAPFIEHVPGAAGLPHRRIATAGHFIQEQQPAALVAGIDTVHHLILGAVEAT